MQRRTFLRATALTGAATRLRFGPLSVTAHSPAGRIGLDTETDRVLIVVQLFGGNDGLNTVIPAEDARYHSRYRPKLGIRKETALRLGQSTAFFHPALKTGPEEGLLGLFKAGKLAVVQGVGYENPDLSHFRSTDIWLSGTVPGSATQRLDSGWVGRFLEPELLGTPPEPLCVRVGGTSSLLFQNRQGDAGIALENPTDFYEQGKGILSGEITPSDGSVFAREVGFLADLALQSYVYSGVVKRAFDSGKNAVEYEKNALSEQARLAARLISGGLKSKVYLLSLDGFDTHANQGGAEGQHAALLTQLSTAIAALMADLNKQGLADRVLGLTVSEFGRRPEENASSGTDHGAAGVQFLFGNAVKGRLVGTGLSFDSLDTNRDFKHQFDYRRVYDEVLQVWFGASPEVVRNVLGQRFDLIESGLLRRSGEVLGVEEPALSLTAFPNPTPDGALTLRLLLVAPSSVRIRQTDLQGREFGILFAGNLSVGPQVLPLRLRGGAGVWLLQVEADGRSETLRVVWG